MEFKFNTGRLYTTQGQFIRAKVDTDGSIIFADDSRAIDGRVAASKLVDLSSAREIEFYVMAAYDRNEYTRDEATFAYLMRPAQPDAANQGGATPGASSVLADELDDQDADVVEAFERSGPRSPERVILAEPVGALSDETLAAIAVVALMQALWEDANGRRRDEEGKKPRTRRGYARLLATVDGFGGPMSDRYRAIALRDYYENETSPVR
jgi:hypothetical protein